MPFNMFGSVYRNQVFGTFNRQANCQGSSQYCGNPNAQLPGWLQQLEGNCSSRCMACNGNENKLTKIQYINKKIQGIVGVSESEFITNLTGGVVNSHSRAPFKNKNFNKNFNKGEIFAGIPTSIRPFYGAGTWNQASDRPLPAGSRVKKSKTGSSIHVGIGVDVKHNSYARYLARIKGKNLKVKNISNNNLQQIVNTLNKNKPVVNNKPLPLMIVQQAMKTSNACACPIKK